MYNEIAHQLGIRNIKINGTNYGLKLMPAFPAMELAKQILTFVGPTLSAIFDKMRTADDVLPEEDMTFTEISYVLVRQLKDIQLTSVMKQLLDGLVVDGKQVDPDEHFRGKLKDMLLVLEFSIKENGILDFFTDFLREKGLPIPSLGELQGMMMIHQPDTTSEEPSGS